MDISDKKPHELREMQYDYCREHLEYFVDTYGHIEDKDAEVLIQPFRIWDQQRQALRSFKDHKLNVILKARQLGITWLVLHYALWKMLKPGRTVIGLSRTEDEAQELVRRMAVILDSIRELFAPKNDQPINWVNATWENTSLILTIHFANGPDSVFKCFPSSPNAARSFTADLIIFDEWAFQQFAEDIWKAGFPTINRPSGGQVIGLSTIERGSFFENVFTNPDNGFNKIFIPWYADPRRDEEWYENTKRTMGDLITQEYPATIDEALTVPGGSFFPEVKRETHIVKKELEGKLRRYVCIDYGLDMLSAHWIQVDTKGNAQIYREYDAPDKTIGAACDILLSMSEGEDIQYWLAPSDLWSRSQETGKSRAILFSENGINLTKTSRDFPAGCASMKEWLKVVDEHPKLTILDGCAPNLYRCLQKIQKDKKRPNVYAKDPHDLTHACLVGGTLVATTKGYKRIDELALGGDHEVFCVDKKGRIRKSKVTDARMTRMVADVYEIELEDGTKVQATPDHKFMTEDGYKTLQEINVGDCITQFCFDESSQHDIQDYSILSCSISWLKKFFHKRGKHDPQGESS